MLKIEKLTKQYGKVKVLDECSLELKPYEIYGVLGKNGCGKSTLFKSVMGQINTNQGEITYKEEVLGFEQRKRFGYMPEQRALLLDLSVRDQLIFLGELKKITPENLNIRIDRLAEEFKVTALLPKRIGSLSKGQQQKVQLMAALLHEPELLILDEPLNGLDYASVQLFMSQLRKFASSGHSVLLSSHQMDFMDELCTHVLVLDKGKTIRQGRLEALQEEFGVCIRVNSDSKWQGLCQDVLSIQDRGTSIELHFASLVKAKKALSRLNKEPSIIQLSLHFASIGDMLELES